MWRQEMCYIYKPEEVALRVQLPPQVEERVVNLGLE
jgi:hypothetical protein